MNKENFIADKMKILVGKENYSRAQAFAIANSYWNKEGQKAQAGGQWYENNPPMFSTDYGQLLPQAPTLQTQQPVTPTNNTGYTNYIQGDANLDGVVNQMDKPQNPYTQNSVNITNPYGNVSLENALNFAGEGFGSKDYGKAAVGTGLSLLKGARNFLTGFSTGRENQRVGQEYFNNQFADNRNFTYGQQGGVKNSDVIAQNAIVDNPQGSNVNLEGKEFVMRNNGQVQPVIGDKHIENGKKADGVNAQLEDGDKVLSNYVKLKPNDIKELKDRYDISLKKGATFADAQKKLDQKLGIKKLETEKSDILEKIEKATKIKDTDTKQLSLEVLTKKTGDVNEKLNTLSGVRADNFEFLFNRQEAQPKQGDGTQLYDKNGKEVTESKGEVAQQGGYINLSDSRKINATTGRPINPNVDLVSGKYSQDTIRKIIEASKNNGVDPYTALAMSLQETGIGKTDSNVGHIIGNQDVNLTGEPEEDFVRILKSKLDYAGKLGKKTEEERLQAYNGYGKVGANTENDYHGYDMKSIYGVDIPKEGIDMSKNPLYGKRVLDYRENIVKKNADINKLVESTKASRNPFTGEKGLYKNPKLTEFLQQGGQIESLAKKHGISLERAQELMSYQQGGIQSEQEVPQEQEASQESQMQQVFQAVAEMLQQGMHPEQVAEQLAQMGVPEEQVGQLIQEVAQQLQGQSSAEEQMEGQYSNEQEEGIEVAQQGGEKEHYEEGGEYTKEDQKAKLDDFYRMSSGLGYEGKKEIGDMQNWMADNYPDEVVKYFTENGQPLTAKHVDLIKNKYNNVFKDTGISANKKSEDYTKEEKLKLQTALGEKADQNFLLEGFKDNKWDWRFPMVAQKPMTPAQGTNKAQITAPSMSRFYSPEEQFPAVEVEPQAEVQKQAETPASGVRNIMPNFGSYIPLFSPMQSVAKMTSNVNLLEPIKTTPEPMLAEQERQRLTDVERIEQAGMSPQQTEALLAQGLASSQMASNDAISKAEQANIQNQFATNQYNVGAITKQDIMNNQYLNDYQDKVMATLANQEESMRNQYRSNFLQEQANSNKVINMNTANALNNQFAITDQGVIPLNNKAYEITPDLKAYEAIRNMTTDEYNTYKKMMALKGLKT